jgi:hypothetical protein
MRILAHCDGLAHRACSANLMSLQFYHAVCRPVGFVTFATEQQARNAQEAYNLWQVHLVSTMSTRIRTLRLSLQL